MGIKKFPRQLGFIVMMKIKKILRKLGLLKVGTKQMVGNFQEGTNAISAAAQERTNAISAAAQEKMNKLLTDYKEVIFLLTKTGIKVENFEVTTGIGIPQINTSLSGSIRDFQLNEMQNMIESRPDNKLLGLMLKSLVTVKEFQEKSRCDLNDVTIEVSLGVPPKITVNLSDSVYERKAFLTDMKSLLAES